MSKKIEELEIARVAAKDDKGYTTDIYLEVNGQHLTSLIAEEDSLFIVYTEEDGSVWRYPLTEDVVDSLIAGESVAVIEEVVEQVVEVVHV